MLLSSDRPQPLGGKVVVMLTLQELKKMTEKPEENQKPPTARFLMEQETLLVSKEIGEGVRLSIYRNGYAVYRVGRSVTVFSMKGVYFGYAANETLLKDININVYAGNKIAIVGPSGSGKTSITKLMMNIFDTYEGHILINGVEIDKINRESYYKKLAVVTQQPLAFNDTIRKNIDPSETLDDNQIYEVLKQAELYDEIMQFPLKLNTKIGENGQNISGGQKQRIAIARALASNPSIVIFDEGTSNLDSVTEKSIFENLNEKGITQIIISHRLSTTQDADYIYVIKDGKIVESGKHDELIKKMGVYYQNYTSYQ